MVPLVTAASALLAIAALIISVHVSRAQAHERYRQARGHQDRQLANTLPPRQPEQAPPETDLCVSGVDTFASAIARTIGSDATKDEKRPLLAPSSGRPQLLARISDAAIRAERFAENATPAPTLGKRMGSTERGGTRVAIEPPAKFCEGRAFAAAPLEPIQLPSDQSD